MAEDWLSPAEATMKQTIEWLLALPARERELLEMAEEVRFTMEDPAPGPEGPATAGSPLLRTMRCGSLDAVPPLCEHNLDTAVLNFAHGYNCGGGFDHCRGSQEEYIFRHSSVFLSLWPHRRADDGPGVLRRGRWIGDFDAALPRKEPFYEHATCGGIYSPHVLLPHELPAPGAALRATSDTATPRFAVLTVAAQNVARDGPFDPALLRQKVRTILHMACSHGKRALILGAFGCGYFGNDPEVVAGTFDELLRGEFCGYFSVVVFAVPDSCGPNWRAFSERFPVSSEGELKNLLLQRQH